MGLEYIRCKVVLMTSPVVSDSCSLKNTAISALSKYENAPEGSLPVLFSPRAL